MILLERLYTFRAIVYMRTALEQGAGSLQAKLKQGLAKSNPKGRVVAKYTGAEE